MASQLTISPPSDPASSSAAAVFPDAVGPNTAITRAMTSPRDDGDLPARQRLGRRPVDLDQHDVALVSVTAEQGRLVTPRAAAQDVWIRAAGAFHQHLLGAADQRGVAGRRVALHRVDQAD